LEKPKILNVKYKIFDLAHRHPKEFELDRSETHLYWRVIFFSFESVRYELRISWVCIGRRRNQLDRIRLYSTKSREQLLPTAVRKLHDGMKATIINN